METRLLGLRCTGYDNVDLAAAETEGITVTVSTGAVCEWRQYSGEICCIKEELVTLYMVYSRFSLFS